MGKFDKIFIYIMVNMVIAINYNLFFVWLLIHEISATVLLGDIMLWHFIIAGNPLFAYIIYDVWQDHKEGD